MLIGNTCVCALLFGSVLLSMCTAFTLQNDLQQIQYQDSLCIFRCYFSYSVPAASNYSFLIQALYRYIAVIYPTRLFYQSAKFQLLFICIAWTFAFLYPTVFIFTNEIIYNVDNQICQIPLKFSFVLIYGLLFIYLIPVSMIMLTYLKLVRYVRAMSKRVTPANTLLRAQRDLKMVQRTVKLIDILWILDIPFILFTFMSFFTSLPKYHFRIAYIFFDVSLVFVMIALFQFNDPLKSSIMNKIKIKPNRMVATIA